MAQPVSDKLPSIAEIAKIQDAEIQACYTRIRKVFYSLTKKADKDIGCAGARIIEEIERSI